MAEQTDRLKLAFLTCAQVATVLTLGMDKVVGKAEFSYTIK